MFPRTGRAGREPVGGNSNPEPAPGEDTGVAHVCHVDERSDSQARDGHRCAIIPVASGRTIRTPEPPALRPILRAIFWRASGCGRLPAAWSGVTGST